MTKNAISGYGKPSSTAATKTEVDRLTQLMFALVVVVIIGFIALLITVAGLAFSYIHDSQDVYRQSRDATNAQNDKIDTLMKVIRDEQKTFQKNN